MNWTIGVDVGGTFTDFCVIAEGSGEVRLWKRPSTPDNPAVAILQGLDELAEAHGIPLADVTRLAHGTTVATNALIQRKGRPVALVTTRGFRDLVEIGRQTRPHVYDLQRDFPAPLVPRHRRLEVTERMTAAGTVHKPVDLQEVDAAIAAIAGMSIESVAVCFLFAFLDGRHERQVADRIRRALPGLQVSLSSEVQPEFREFERFNTTIINAYLQPVVAEYLQWLETEMHRRLPRASVGINQSSGGLMSLSRAKAFPVRTALSGPAAGVVGALHIAVAVGRRNAITIDVGGTSADIAVIRNGRFEVSSGRDVDGFPVRLPMVDIQTIGAGGGSIAAFERDGLLKMGPGSAGARPGPACYGLGGSQPTLSDANLVLGRLSPSLLGGAMTLDPALARASIEPIAATLGKSVEETAQGMVAISVANMVRAIRVMSVERGHDPRDYVLVPFGGAGPLHARDIARALSIAEIIVPRAPGIVCAQGLVLADLVEEFTGGMRTTITDAAPRRIMEAIVGLSGRARAWAGQEGIPADGMVHEWTLDMRYVGQNFELPIPLRDAAMPPLEQMRTMFFRAHETSYGYFNPDDPLEIVNFRLAARGRLKFTEPPAPGRASNRNPESIGERPVWFAPDAPSVARLYQREALLPGHEIAGPAVVEQLDATTLVYPGDRARVDDALNLLLEVTV